MTTTLRPDKNKTNRTFSKKLAVIATLAVSVLAVGGTAVGTASAQYWSNRYNNYNNNNYGYNWNRTYTAYRWVYDPFLNRWVQIGYNRYYNRWEFVYGYDRYSRSNNWNYNRGNYSNYNGNYYRNYNPNNNYWY